MLLVAGERVGLIGRCTNTCTARLVGIVMEWLKLLMFRTPYRELWRFRLLVQSIFVHNTLCHCSFSDWGLRNLDMGAAL